MQFFSINLFSEFNVGWVFLLVFFARLHFNANVVICKKYVQHFFLDRVNGTDICNKIQYFFKHFLNSETVLSKTKSKGACVILPIVA